MQPAERGWVLPSVTVEGRQAPFDAQHGDVAHVREDVRRELDVDATVLECLYACTDRSALMMDAVYAVEIHGGAWRMPNGARWVGRAELQRLEMAFPEHRAPLVQHLEEAESGDVPEQRPRWSRPGWHAEAVDWISSQVEILGYRRTGDIRQRKMWGLSAILEVPTDQGPLFFKEACRSPLFADEPAVTSALAGLFPGMVPPPLAVEAKRRWMLLTDFGDDLLVRNADIQVWEGVVESFARLQMDSIAHLDLLLSSGCLDRRLRVMSAQIDGLLQDADALSDLDAGEVASVRALAPDLKASCARLGELMVPQTLMHGDLNSGNVALGDGRCVFFDWTDACVAHPFFDLVTLLVENPDHGERLPDVPSARERLIEAYLGVWSAYQPMERLREAWALAEPLGWLHQAISYRYLLRSLEASWHNWSPAWFLRGMLRALSDP